MKFDTRSNEAAEILGVDQEKVCSWRKHGLLHAVQKGHRWYFSRENCVQLAEIRRRYPEPDRAWRMKAKVLAAEYAGTLDKPGWIEKALAQ